jgi:GNAT superfamily N-acetyltransferase
MASDFATRPASSGDAVAISALINSAYRGDSSRAGWTTEADLLGGQRTDVGWITEIITTDGNLILVHEQNQALVACVHLERTGDDCYLGMLTVKPTRQSAGIGRQLLAAAERWAVAKWSTRAMHLTVIVQRPELVAWYERCGYQQTDQRKAFPYGDERFGLPRRPDLAFVVMRKLLARGD